MNEVQVTGSTKTVFKALTGAYPGNIMPSHSILQPLMNKVYLKRKISTRVANGHPWIFNNEVEKIEGEVKGGEITEVFSHDKKFIGKGYINPRSQILVRLLTRNKQDEINEQFFI